MKISLVFLLLVFTAPVFGQWVVSDPANTAVNTAIKGNQIAQHADTMRQWAEQLEKLNRQIRQVEDLLVAPPPQIPHVQPVAVLLAEEQLGIDAAAHHVGRAPLAADQGVVAQVPPEVVVQELRAAAVVEVKI